MSDTAQGIPLDEVTPGQLAAVDMLEKEGYDLAVDLVTERLIVLTMRPDASPSILTDRTLDFLNEADRTQLCAALLSLMSLMANSYIKYAPNGVKFGEDL